MFLRRYERRSGGRGRTYWALVESVRTGRGSRQRVVAYLGELKRSEQSGWAQLGRKLSGKQRPQRRSPREGKGDARAVHRAAGRIAPENAIFRRVRTAEGGSGGQPAAGPLAGPRSRVATSFCPPKPSRATTTAPSGCAASPSRTTPKKSSSIASGSPSPDACGASMRLHQCSGTDGPKTNVSPLPPMNRPAQLRNLG